MALLGELGDVGVESLGQGLPDGVGVVDTRLHLDVVLPAQVDQLFSHLDDKLHVSKVDKVVLAKLLLVLGLAKGLEDFEEGNVVALAGDEGLA